MISMKTAPQEVAIFFPRCGPEALLLKQCCSHSCGGPSGPPFGRFFFYTKWAGHAGQFKKQGHNDRLCLKIQPIHSSFLCQPRTRAPPWRGRPPPPPRSSSCLGSPRPAASRACRPAPRAAPPPPSAPRGAPRSRPPCPARPRAVGPGSTPR